VLSVTSRCQSQLTTPYVHVEVKQETNKDGSGKGKMAAWKAGDELAEAGCQPGIDQAKVHTV